MRRHQNIHADLEIRQDKGPAHLTCPPPMYGTIDRNWQSVTVKMYRTRQYALGTGVEPRMSRSCCLVVITGKDDYRFIQKDCNIL
jgi:hypothetical protein